MIIPWSDHCVALLGLHACIGSDYTASFSQKGKVRPLALLEKNQNAIEIFSKLGDEEVINATMNNVQMPKNLYVVYGQKKLPSIAEARLEMFLKKYKPKIEKNPILCKKDGWQFFASMFPSYFAETKKDKLCLQCLA